MDVIKSHCFLESEEGVWPCSVVWCIGGGV